VVCGESGYNPQQLLQYWVRENIIFSTDIGNYFDTVWLDLSWRNPCVRVEYSKQ